MENTKTPYPTPQQRTQTLLDHLLATPALPVDYERWNIQGAMPQDSVLLFISEEYMASFAHWKDFSCKTIKLANYDKPAVRMTMFLTHRYKIRKSEKMSPMVQRKTIQAAIDTLLEEQNTIREKLTQRPSDRAELSSQLQINKRALQQWQTYADNAGEYEVAISNYERYYLYHTLNYKYETRTDNEEKRYANESVHLIKTQVDVNATTAQTRYNVVFIDLDQLLKPAPYQHKVIHTYLATFTDKKPINNNKDMVYIRRKDSPEVRDN